MNLQALKAELQNDPLGIGYAAHLPHAPGKVAELINAHTRSVVKPRPITNIGIGDKFSLGPVAAGELLKKLRDLGALVHIVEESYYALRNRSNGMDIGTPTAQMMILQLPQICSDAGLTDAEGAPRISAIEAQALADMAKQSGSRAEELFGAGSIITEQNITEAMQ